jgi:hypothetical protein
MNTQSTSQSIISVTRPTKAQGQAYRQALRALPTDRLWELWDNERSDLSRCWFAEMVRHELVERSAASFNSRGKGHGFGRRDRSHKQPIWATV